MASTSLFNERVICPTAPADDSAGPQLLLKRDAPELVLRREDRLDPSSARLVKRRQRARFQRSGSDHKP